MIETAIGVLLTYIGLSPNIPNAGRMLLGFVGFFLLSHVLLKWANEKWGWRKSARKARQPWSRWHPWIEVALSFVVAVGLTLVSNRVLFPTTEVTAKIVNPARPALVVVNPSDVVVEGIYYQVALYNIDAEKGLQIPSRTWGWLPAGKEGAPLYLFQGQERSISAHDRILGSISVNCPQCDRGYTYWVYIVWGNGGWYAELTDVASGAVRVPTGVPKHLLKDALLQIANGIKPEQQQKIETWIPPADQQRSLPLP